MLSFIAFIHCFHSLASVSFLSASFSQHAITHRSREAEAVQKAAPNQTQQAPTACIILDSLILSFPPHRHFLRDLLLAKMNVVQDGIPQYSTNPSLLRPSLQSFLVNHHPPYRQALTNCSCSREAECGPEGHSPSRRNNHIPTYHDGRSKRGRSRNRIRGKHRKGGRDKKDEPIDQGDTQPYRRKDRKREKEKKRQKQ